MIKNIYMMMLICLFSICSSAMDDKAALKNTEKCDKYWGKRIETAQAVLAKFEQRLKDDNNSYFIKEEIKKQKIRLERLNSALSYCYTDGIDESRRVSNYKDLQ